MFPDKTRARTLVNRSSFFACLAQLALGAKRGLLTTKGTKTTKFGLLSEPLDLDLWVVTEVYDEAKLEAGGVF